MTESVTVRLAAEKLAHDMVRQVAQDLWDRHGVRLDSAEVSWFDVATVEGVDFRVVAVKLQTVTRA